MDWTDPAARLALIERVGPEEYNRQHREHMARQTIETRAGHALRYVQTGFGRLVAIGNTGRAFSTLDQARDYADQHPA